MGRREAKKQLKRERMMKEGLRLFLEQGYERASVEQIAQAVGVARGTFYLYFPDKLALFAALMDGWHGTVMGMLSDVHAQLRQANTEAEAWRIYRDMGTGLSWVGLANRDEILLAFREMRTSTEAGQLLRERETALLAEAIAFTETGARPGPDPGREPQAVRARGDWSGRAAVLRDDARHRSRRSDPGGEPGRRDLRRGDESARVGRCRGEFSVVSPQFSVAETSCCSKHPLEGAGNARRPLQLTTDN